MSRDWDCFAGDGTPLVNPLEYLGLGLLGLLVGASLLLGHRVYRGVLFWSWAWVIQILAGLLLSTDGSPELIAILLATLFPLLQFAGTLDYLDRPVPNWFVALGTVILAVKIALFAMGHPGAVTTLTWFTEIPLLAACALFFLLKDGEKWSRIGLSLGFGLLVALEIYDAFVEFVGEAAYFELWLWVLFAVPLGAVQIYAWSLRAIRTSQAIRRERGARQSAEDRYGALVGRTHDVLAEVDAGGKVVYVSPNAEVGLGIKAEDLVGKTVFQVIEAVRPEPDLHDRVPTFADTVAAQIAAGPYGKTYRFVPADGNERWVEVKASRYPTHGGDQHVLAVIRDITYRRRLEMDAIRAQKLESLGMLAAGVAHDFNNLLATVLFNAEMAGVDLADGDVKRARGRLGSLEGAVLQAKALTQQLLVYAGKGTMVPEVMDASTQISRMGELLKAMVGDSVKLEMHLESGLDPVEIDPGQLQETVLNLIANAKDAMPGGGTVDVRVTSAAKLPPNAILPAPSTGPYICIEVSDTGTGMEPETMGKVFDPFFTTRFDGRGIGLASVFGVLRMLGGAVAVESTLDVGSSFKVFLPVTDKPVEAPVPVRKVAGERVLQASGVLVVDDYDESRILLADALRRVGRTVYKAGNGQEAIDVLASGADIGTVIMDLAMPGLAGRALVDELRLHVPDIKILVISGYNETIVEAELEGAVYDGFMQKPFHFEELHDALDDVETSMQGMEEGA